MKLPFPNGLAALEKLPKSRESLVNLFNNGEGAVIPRPGIDLITAVGGIARAQFVWNGALYQVSSNSLLKITNTTTGAHTVVGSIGGNEIVETAIGFNTAVLVVRGGSIYTLDKSDTIVEITNNDNFQICDAVTHIDGRFIYIPTDGANPAFFSDVGNAGSVQAASFFDAEELPDQNTTTFNLRNTLYIGGTDSFELFRDTGASPVPFQRLTGARLDYGYIGGLQAYADTYLFIGREKDQNYGVYAINQGRADKISNEAIDTILGQNSLGVLSEAVTTRFKWRGYDLITFTLSTASFALYNGQWFLLSTLIDGRETVWGAGFITQFDGEYYSAGAKVFGRLSDANTEYGNIIPRMIDIPFAHPENEWFSAQSVSLAISQGFNPPTETTVGQLVSNPDFATEDDWTLGDGWSIGSGAASCDGSQAAASPCEQALDGLKASTRYKITFEITSYTAGSLSIHLGTTTGGISFSGVGTHTQEIVTLSTASLRMFANVNFIGSIDNIVVSEIVSVKPTVGMALSRNNVEYGPLLYRELGAIGEYTSHLDWNYPGGLGSYDGFMGLRFYTTQNVDFDTNGLFAHIRA